MCLTMAFWCLYGKALLLGEVDRQSVMSSRGYLQKVAHGTQTVVDSELIATFGDTTRDHRASSK